MQQNNNTEHSINGINYTLIKKKIKNINLRIDINGQIVVSAPVRCSKKEVENFILLKKEWIIKSQQRLINEQAHKIIIDKSRTNEAQALFEEISMQIFPLFSSVLNEIPPIIKVRDMKTRWGVCHIKKRYISLNLQLLSKPMPCIKYVILHEYVHFLVPNHSQKFWQTLEVYMPNYKEIRKLLKNNSFF